MITIGWVKPDGSGGTIAKGEERRCFLAGWSYGLWATGDTWFRQLLQAEKRELRQIPLKMIF